MILGIHPRFNPRSHILQLTPLQFRHSLQQRREKRPRFRALLPLRSLRPWRLKFALSISPARMIPIMDAVVEVVIHESSFARWVARVDEHVVEERGAGGECGFREAELELVAKRYLVAIHESAVCALSDPSLTVVAGC